MRISALASGSSGNCFYVENEKTAVLIDVGISCKQVVKRIEKVNGDLKKIKAIFITHEHTDHIKGAGLFARKFNVPIYATKRTIKNSFLVGHEKANEIRNNETINLGEMKIEAFSKMHDASDPVSYNIWNGKKISIITDIGKVCKNVIENVADSDFLCFEANHDLGMLETGPYPAHIKQRIKGDYGHLSNFHSGVCVLEHATPKLKHVVLAHLSKVNNTPLSALTTFSNLIQERKDLNIKVGLSYREKPTELFKI